MKRVLILVLVMGLVFLVGCDSGEDAPTTQSVFVEGTQGLVVSFEVFGFQEGGISTIYDTDSFPIEMILKNVGEETLEPGDVQISLKGINLNDFENIPTGFLSNSKKIEGVSEFNPEGGEELIDFTPGDNAKYKHSVTGFYNPDIFGTVEYRYKTRLIAPKICFKGDLTDTSVCTVKESKEIFVSGAPMTITSLVEDVRGRGIIDLAFEISNVGGGRATKVGEVFDPRYDTVTYTMKTDPEKWDCRSAGLENEARLVDGKATVHCYLKEPLGEGELYTKQVELELDYTYKSVIQESLKIKESQS
ncbi:hypothetical protein ACFLZB_04420 [Nanoarchaeota archaeon]